jgi:GNAT superfamily N-acetyltransferase
MKFRTFDELTPSMETDRNLLHLTAFGNVFPRRTVDRYRRAGDYFAEYVGVFAEEKGRLLGQTFVLRIPYTFPDGTEAISGIAGVSTRPDRGRAGVARAILTEVERREREAGIRFATLWTNRSWGAHHLYEQLGYRDVYSSPWVVHGPEPVAPRRPAGVRPGRRSDLDEVERLHARHAEGRLGFLRQPNGYTRLELASGWLDPTTQLIVAGSGRRLLGYAALDPSPFRTICGEIVASSPATRRALIAGVRWRAKGGALAFQHTPVTDDPRSFAGHGYSEIPNGWYVFMAHPVGRTWGARAAVNAFATNDPRFLCLAGDRF